MNYFPSRLALVLITGLIAQAAVAADPVATVNGKAIPAARAATMLAEQTAQGAVENAELRDAVREELIRREVLAQAATQAGLDKQEDIQAQMELARQAVLIRAYLQDYVKNHPVTDDAARAEYEKIKAQMSGANEYKPRHILVETDTEAKVIIAKLAAGEKFETLASQSKDPGSKDKGGDLGWSNPAMFVKPFADALVQLEKGQYTKEPVKSDFGYHVIQLDDVRQPEAPSFEEVKPQLQQRMQQQVVEKHMLDLRAKAEVK